MILTTLLQCNFPGGITGVQAGEGPAMVMIHGVGLQAAAWQFMIPLLEKEFSITALNMPGHGGSVSFGPAENPGLTDYSDRMAEAINSLPTPVIIVGHSMGAFIALDLAIRFPDNVSGVVALNSVFRRSPEASSAIKARVSELATKGSTKHDGTLERWFGTARVGLTGQMADLCRDWLTQMDPVSYRQAYSVFARKDGPNDDDLTNLRCPALFVTGNEDPNSTPSMAKAMSEIVPDGDCEVVNNAKHMMPMTHASDVCETIVNFVQSRVKEHG